MQSEILRKKGYKPTPFLMAWEEQQKQFAKEEGNSPEPVREEMNESFRPPEIVEN